MDTIIVNITEEVFPTDVTVTETSVSTAIGITEQPQEVTISVTEEVTPVSLSITEVPYETEILITPTTGDTGLSAYEIAVQNGFVGTESEWLASLNGTDGEDGYTPIKGVDYFDGVDGYTPVKGVDYVDGVDGTDGYTPVKGVDYFDGVDGADGQGVPTGGNTDELLVKKTGADYDTKWVDKSTLGFQPAGAYLTTETDPVFEASEAHNFVTGDKAKLDNTSNFAVAMAIALG